MPSWRHRLQDLLPRHRFHAYKMWRYPTICVKHSRRNIDMSCLVRMYANSTLALTKMIKHTSLTAPLWVRSVTLMRCISLMVANTITLDAKVLITRQVSYKLKRMVRTQWSIMSNSIKERLSLMISLQHYRVWLSKRISRWASVNTLPEKSNVISLSLMNHCTNG